MVNFAKNVVTKLTLKDSVLVSVLSVPAQQAKRLDPLVRDIKLYFKNAGQELLVELNLEKEAQLHTSSEEIWVGEAVLKALFIR